MTETIPWWSIPATVAAAITVLSLIRGGYRRTLGRRSQLRRNLNKLACGTTPSYVDSLLGEPLSIDVQENRVNRIYRSAYAYVVVSAPGVDVNIDAFSVTIRARRFRPRFRFSTSRLTVSMLDVDLSKSRFRSVPARPDGQRCMIGANRFGYTEQFYFGNPGHYQTYLLGNNDAAGDLISIPDEFPSFATGDLINEAEDAGLRARPPEDVFAAVRDGMRVNTLTVIGPAATSDVLMSYLGTGVDRDTVRSIPE